MNISIPNLQSRQFPYLLNVLLSILIAVIVVSPIIGFSTNGIFAMIILFIIIFILLNSITNEKIKASIEKVKREIFSGRPFSVSLRETKDFPETMCGFIEVGEETGKLNEMLTTVSLYYEGEFDSSVDAFSSMLEPIMIVFLGVVIGFILVAMYQPIFLMGSAV